MTVVLHRRYPCCDGSSRFPSDGEPGDTYARRCPSCKAKWTARRRLATRYVRERVGQPVHVIEWERAEGRSA